MSWTEEREQRLRKLWEKGYTASQIAEMLGGDTTRNAVIGKAHRLKLAARATSKQPGSPKKQDTVSGPNKRERYVSRKSGFKSLLLDKNFEVENPKKLEELGDKNCRWPIGHPNEENFYFCGRNPVDGFSYCKLHVLYAFQPKNQKEEPIDKEDDVPAFLEKKIKATK
jgi:GcrA cell cycle regulator